MSRASCTSASSAVAHLMPSMRSARRTISPIRDRVSLFVKYVRVRARRLREVERGRGRSAGIHECSELTEDLAAADLDRTDLGDLRALGYRPAGGLEVH